MSVVYETPNKTRDWVRTNPMPEFDRSYLNNVAKKAASRKGHERIEEIRKSLQGEDFLLAN